MSFILGDLIQVKNIKGFERWLNVTLYKIWVIDRGNKKWIADLKFFYHIQKKTKRLLRK
ncbi:hypothetical protein GCM10008986_16590 [Salinibacillus aidingensis]|uniref:Uncharacterized protein n=1 Tax=Salinibacillus aidingensis TaxID=237684 RepID=A0ABP3L5I5_9BACI